MKMKNEHERERVFQKMFTVFLIYVQLFNSTSILEKVHVYLFKVHNNENRQNFILIIILFFHMEKIYVS